jgi:hypothetical protein
MSVRGRQAAPAAGVALFVVALAALVVTTTGERPTAGAGEVALRLLPTSAAEVAAPAPPRIVATPAPRGSRAAPPGQAGVWSTPAEFAPPE